MQCPVCMKLIMNFKIDFFTLKIFSEYWKASQRWELDDKVLVFNDLRYKFQKLGFEEVERSEKEQSKAEKSFVEISESGRIENGGQDNKLDNTNSSVCIVDYLIEKPVKR